MDRGLCSTVMTHFLITYILPCAYLGLSLWGLQKMARPWGYTAAFPSLFLLAKVACGLLYTWVMLRYIPAAKVDIYTFFGDGKDLYHHFLQDPAAFPQYLREWFALGDVRLGETNSGIVQSAFGGIKLIHFGLCLLSGGKLFTNVLLFNCISSILFLRAWYWLRKHTGRGMPGFFILLFPPAFFFTSVVLKEGIEWALIACLIPAGYALAARKRVVANTVAILLLLALMCFFKFLIGATFILAMGVAGGMYFFQKYRGLVFGCTLAVGAVLFFTLPLLHPALHLPQYIIDRRLEFMELEANSALTMRTLQPHALSFLQALPEALAHVFLSPWPGQPVKVIYFAFLPEMLLFWILLLVLAIGGRRQMASQVPPLAWGLLLFGLVNLLIIGFSITNVGAIIRYRSIFLPLILVFATYAYTIPAGWQGILHWMRSLIWKPVGA